MPEPTRIDAERLAALMDGRLPAEEAAELRRILAHADEATLAAYADAVAIAAELGTADAAEPARDVRPIAAARPRPSRWIAPAGALLAAGLVGIAVLRSAKGTPGDVTSGLNAPAPGLPQWSVTRAGDAPVTSRGRAVRLGVLLVQHELAARRADTSAASRARMIATLLDGVPGGSALAGRWRSPDDASDAARAEDAQLVRSLAGTDLVRLGEWLEGARSAATAGQSAWFDANQPAPVTSALRSANLAAPDAAALREVERVVRERPLDLHRVAGAATAAEEALGR